MERQSGLPRHFVEYIHGEGTARYEVSTFGLTTPNGTQMSSRRQPISPTTATGSAGCSCSRKTFNASYGDLPYEKKVEHYFGQNILAQSLHPRAYELHPGFVAYVRRSSLPFWNMEEFRRTQLDERQKLYRLLAEEVWSPNRLEVAR